MTDVKSTNIFGKYKEPMERFFLGKLYPFIIAALVLIGHTTGLEFYLNIPIILSASLAFIVCDSIKPFLPTMLTFLYQINQKHSPGIPYWSDYYSTDYITSSKEPRPSRSFPAL